MAQLGTHFTGGFIPTLREPESQTSMLLRAVAPVIAQGLVGQVGRAAGTFVDDAATGETVGEDGAAVKAPSFLDVLLGGQTLGERQAGAREKMEFETEQAAAKTQEELQRERIASVISGRKLAEDKAAGDAVRQLHADAKALIADQEKREADRIKAEREAERFKTSQEGARLTQEGARLRNEQIRQALAPLTEEQLAQTAEDRSLKVEKAKAEIEKLKAQAKAAGSTNILSALDQIYGDPNQNLPSFTNETEARAAGYGKGDRVIIAGQTGTLD